VTPAGVGPGEVGRDGRPQVAVVGRPNVGKSSLVNRLAGRRVAIVEEHPGVTRDRREVEVHWSGQDFLVVDTGGWLPGGGPLERKVSAQAERAVEQADLVLCVLDAVVGVTAEDLAFVDYLRRRERPTLLVANKVDDQNRESDAWALAGLGLGAPWMVSAIHGRGTGDLLDEVVRRLAASAPGAEGFVGAPIEESPERSGGSRGPGPDQEAWPVETRAADTPLEEIPQEEIPGAVQLVAETEERVPAVAIVGRPNVGKSTLFNRLVGDERAVVHDLPGTTTDAIDTLVETPEGSLRLIDTAGLRRRSRIGEGVEFYSLVRALAAIDRADVAVLVVDATVGVTHQDQRLAERVDAAGSPVVVVANKWELLDAEQRERVRADAADRLGFLPALPLVGLSAKTGRGVHRLLPAIRLALGAYRRRIPTRELNLAVQAAQRAHPAPTGRILYATQGATDPPTFTLFVTGPLPADWLRYLERRLRERFGLGPTPLVFRVRPRDGSGPRTPSRRSGGASPARKAPPGPARKTAAGANVTAGRGKGPTGGARRRSGGT